MNDTSTAPGELRFSRVFDAPRELVFRCMIEPGHLTHFWGPAGTSAPVEHIHVDPRRGGRFETVMINDSDGSQYATHATFVEVTEPERLVWTETGQRHDRHRDLRRHRRRPDAGRASSRPTCPRHSAGPRHRPAS